MSTDNHSRRKFIKVSVQAGAVITAAPLAGLSLLDSCSVAKKGPATAISATSFNQQPLPYSYTALEPHIDARTMEIHFTKHAAAYATNLQDAAKAEGVSSTTPLEDVLANISKYSAKMRNNGGGHYNHELFWKCMKASGEGTPSGKLLQAIDSSFGSFANFKLQFSEAAKTRFGSGWAWLYADASGKLKIGSTPNQDNPLMNAADIKGIPLLGLDVWEHAYYLKYQNKRADYVESWWNVVNWDFVGKRFDMVYRGN